MTVASIATALSDLEQDYAANIAAAGLPTQYDNAPFTKPDPPSIWARFTILRGDAEQKEIAPVGSRMHRTVLVLHVQIFVPLETGEGLATVAAEAIADRYNSISRAGCLFRASTIGDGRRDGPWWMVPVRCPFQADRVR